MVEVKNAKLASSCVVALPSEFGRKEGFSLRLPDQVSKQNKTWGNNWKDGGVSHYAQPRFLQRA